MRVAFSPSNRRQSRRATSRASAVLAAALVLSRWVAGRPLDSRASELARDRPLDSPTLKLAQDRPDGGTRFPVHIRVDASKSTGLLKPIWRFFGADEPNYAYMKDGRKLIADEGRLAPKRVYFRAHSLLVTGDGTPALKWGSTNAYREDAQGHPIYDTYLARGVKPYVQIGFMPEALSTKPQPYKHAWTPLAKYDEIYTGWA